jgi:hypothetical protein
VYNSRDWHCEDGFMAVEKAPTVWVPVCCGRVMRYNVFGRADGGAFGTLGCRICGRNITLEQENPENVKEYGERAGVIQIIGSPRPPTEDRSKPESDPGKNEPTL